MGKGRGRPKSTETLNKEAYKEFIEKTNKDFDKTELTGVKAHKSKGADSLSKTLLSGNLKDPKELKVVFDEFKSRGLIPDSVPNLETGGKYYLKDPESLTFWLGQLAKKQYQTPEKFGPKVPGKDPVNQWKIGQLNKLIRDAAKDKIGQANLTPDILEDINKMSWKGLPLKVSETGEISFARRQFSDKVPQTVIDYGNKYLGNDTGTRWAKDARKGWEDLRIQNQKYKELTGFDFDRGHFYPSARGGPNTIRNASSEIAFDIIGKLKSIAGNRDKKDLANWKGTDVGRELGTSNSWMQDLVEFHLDEIGLNANQLPKDYWVDNPGHATIQQGQTLQDQVKAAQSTVAENYQKYITDQQPLPQGKLQSDLEIVNGKVVKKLIQPTKTQEILTVLHQNGNGNGNGNGVHNGVDSLKSNGLVKKALPIYESIVNGKTVKQGITAASKVIDAIPTPVKKAAVVLPVLGAISDGSVIAGTFYDNKETKQQQRINEIKGASGALGLAGFKFPPLWIPSTFMWGVGEMAQWQYNKKKARYKESYQDLYYMEAAAEGMVDAEGNPLDEFINQKVNRQIDADRKTRVGRFKR